ncbi:hypothetical protein MRB53_029654 [Persea americana]|uniref:Uncharacterized protein n=1 Tax=Persea americana TaxID=3435 RepID=A0ACC2KIY7_PERAE|nr:hypothetical protein MRB53_029654 [Persea americana]|eukprot:TRINITY_DN6913_c0_g1_i1.p1 TRINITY_DN6913_c0_g1~~TRINITY_DN6913_c0_g1_i1.p1  ORF type:complete len:214 (+),score=54.08 TRINITY_DN6913_c0_g1_i1:124-765(+)
MPEKETPEKMTPPNPPPFKLILGSSSMSRRQLLAEMGYQFTLMSADIDEKGIRREKPEELVMALAEAKADAIISKLQITDYKNDTEPTLLITADQVVVYEGVIREKPSSKDEARLFVKGYSGSHTSTVGSVLVTNLKTGVRRGAWDKAEVHFQDIPDEVIEELIEEGVVLHVAGGLLLENPLISRFVEAVVGTADSVMGLPKELTEKLIQEAL